MPEEFVIESGGVQLSGEEAGEGPAVLLLHGLTATRRYVVMGSKILERSGHRVIQYDARAHGRSSAAPTPADYTYDLLGEDAIAVLDALGVQRAVLAGRLDGGPHAAERRPAPSRARRRPGRDHARLQRRPRARAGSAGTLGPLGRGAAPRRRGGVRRGLRVPQGDPSFAQTVIKVTRQRLSLHEHPEALADALQALPRSEPFQTLAELSAITVPSAVVVSSDAADPEHPYDIGPRLRRGDPGRPPDHRTSPGSLRSRGRAASSRRSSPSWSAPPGCAERLPVSGGQRAPETQNGSADRQLHSLDSAGRRPGVALEARLGGDPHRTGAAHTG